MEIRLQISKTLEQNAESYFEKAKKARKKLKGARAALEKSYVKLEELKKKQESEKKIISEKKEARQKEWFEKFRWFYSSEGFLCIGGRDATTNEIVIKKHMDSNDIVFHTEMAGSPFFVIKTNGAVPGEATLKETAQATAAYSRAWKLGVSYAEVFYVTPSQISKEALSGEYVSKGAFMIRGKKTVLRPKLEIAIGIRGGIVIGGPVEAVKSNSEKFVVVGMGNLKASDAAKKIKSKIGGELDDIIRFLPSGKYEVN